MNNQHICFNLHIISCMDIFAQRQRSKIVQQCICISILPSLRIQKVRFEDYFILYNSKTYHIRILEAPFRQDFNKVLAIRLNNSWPL